MLPALSSTRALTVCDPALVMLAFAEVPLVLTGVPPSTQAITVLRDLQQLTGKFDYAFPGTRSRARPMSENTVTAALRRMGYSGDDMTGHGFRSMASTLLNEQGWNRDAIERQLAHGERDAVRAAYNYAQHLPERRRMMQAWADYLDQLKVGRSAEKLTRQARKTESGERKSPPQYPCRSGT